MRKFRYLFFAVMPVIIVIGWFYWGYSGTKKVVTPQEEYEELKPEEMLIGGIQMNEPSPEKWIKTLKNVEMNTLEVTVYAQQGRWFDNNLWFYSQDLGVMAEIRNAKQAGMRVVLILRVQMDHAFPENNFLWHGMIFSKDPYMMQRWFEEYERFAKQWGAICEEYKVDVLVLGSEMNAIFDTNHDKEGVPNLLDYYLTPAKQEAYKKKILQFEDKLSGDLLDAFSTAEYKNLEEYLDAEIASKQEWAKLVAFTDSTDQMHCINRRGYVQNWYWGRLIDNVRRVYSGKMTVAANFDNYYDVRFWDKLDFIGINAYFPLRNLNSKKDRMEQFRESWSDILDDITRFKIEQGVPNHPVLFTELGYGNHAGSSLHPWEGYGFSVLDAKGKDSLFVWDKQPIDHSERNDAVRALYEEVKVKRFPLKGILYWKLTTDPEQLQYDPFALQIGESSPDTLQHLLASFRDLEPILMQGQIPLDSLPEVIDSTSQE